MWFRAGLVASLIVLSASRTLATDGYVIDSADANVEVGTEVAGGTAIQVSSGGHVVILTATGQMLRRDGFFEGKAQDAFDLSAPTQAKAEIGAGVLAALMGLARDDGTAQNKVSAARDIPGEAVGGGPFAISVETGFYCHRQGIAPVFSLANPPRADTLISLDRYEEPPASESARWPANQGLFPWPETWAPPREGTYDWMAGNVASRFTVRELPAGAGLDSPLDLALALKGQGCDAQARAALAEAIAGARVVR